MSSAPGAPGAPGAPDAPGAPREESYEQSVDVGFGARVVLARNPSAMTLEGTNTWLLGHDQIVVVDPGPDDETHLQAVLDAAAGRVTRVVLTHGHADHSAGAARLHELSGAPVQALDPAHRYGSEGLVEGSVVMADGVRWTVALTPGHTADSLCLVSAGAVLTGDTVLGQGTTVVAWPDGELGSYLTSLRRLAALGERAVLPGHGPMLPSVGVAATAYLAHREQRLAQVRTILGSDACPGSVEDIVAAVLATVYAAVDPAVWPAARLSVRAQIEYLRTAG